MARLECPVGAKFGRLTVLSEVVGSYGHKKWYCRCDCGSQHVATGRLLIQGHTKSCGCLRAEVCGKRATVHGHARDITGRTPTYQTWLSMNMRCYDEKQRDFPDYGGRGILVCDAWRRSFENFLADMGERPRGRTLDRIDNMAGYSKDNCRWATASEQALNRRPKRWAKAP